MSLQDLEIEDAALPPVVDAGGHGAGAGANGRPQGDLLSSTYAFSLLRAGRNWRRVVNADFDSLVGKRIRLCQDAAVDFSRPDAESGPLGRRADGKVGVVTIADMSDWTLRCDGAWWYAGDDCEFEVDGLGAAAAAPAAGGWRRVTPADFPALAGKRVRLVQDPSVAFTADDAERGPLGSRSEARVGLVTRADASDNSVRVNDGWWYWMPVSAKSGVRGISKPHL